MTRNCVLRVDLLPTHGFASEPEHVFRADIDIYPLVSVHFPFVWIYRPVGMMFEAFGFSKGAPYVAENQLSYLRGVHFGGYSRFF